MPPKAKKASSSAAVEKAPAEKLGGPYTFPTDPQKQQAFFNKISQQAQYEATGAPPAPLDTFLAASATICASSFLVSCALRWWFSEVKPISKHKLIEVLTTTYQMWAQSLTSAGQQEQQILQQQPNMTPEEKKQLSDYMRYRLTMQLQQSEGELLQQANISRDQIQAALKEYESDKQVQKLQQDISKIVSTVVPPPPLPWPWTEDAVLELLQELFDKRIEVMEQVHQALTQGKPQGEPMGAQFVEQINEAYTPLLAKELQKFYEEKGITAQYLQRLIKSVQNGPKYVDTVHRCKQVQRQRYIALGLETKR